jgi:3-mercaptopyruvate sulfurtransferase SseA
MKKKRSPTQLSSISTGNLLERLEDPDLSLIDIRPANAYNGWRLQNENRGGHIKGARSLPAGWADDVDWIDIVRSKGIQPGSHLILYGYHRDEIDKVAEQFTRSGYSNVKAYYDFVAEWSENDNLPMERLARYHQLVPPLWIKSLLENSTAAEYNNLKFVICHAHYRNREDYERGHIPGAVDIDTNTLESPQTWNIRSSGELRSALQEHGITSDTTVVLYGRFSFPDNKDPFPGSRAGQLGAMRCAFIMMYAGVKDVRILNGGLRAWSDEGLEITTGEIEKHPVTDFGAKIPVHPELVVDMTRAKEILASPGKNLISVRSWLEYTGEVSGYNYIEKRGRIPGSVFGNCGSDAYHMESYRNRDHTLREYHEIESMWKQVGITADKYNSFYCGTGWRASEAFFCAWLMGWPRISVFDGGWFQWSSDDKNPRETGVPA